MVGVMGEEMLPRSSVDCSRALRARDWSLSPSSATAESLGGGGMFKGTTFCFLITMPTVSSTTLRSLCAEETLMFPQLDVLEMMDVRSGLSDLPPERE